MPKPALICIPGLGGHPSSFKGYDKLLPEYKVIFTQLIDYRKAFEETKNLCASLEENVVFLTNCYGAQIAMRLIGALPDGKIKGLVIIEPFFAQFHWGRRPALFINKIILKILAIAHKFGLDKKTYRRDIDYFKLARFPIFFQPLFDMGWQSLHFYFDKIEDILRFKLPEQPLGVKSLLIFSPKGFTQNNSRRDYLLRVFNNADIAEVGAKSHNIIALSQNEIADIIRSWLIRLNL